MNLKRTFVFTAAVALLVALPAMQEALASGPEGKTRICHFTQRGAGKGIVIEVSDHAVPHHVRLHNDCVDFRTSSHHGRLCRCNNGGGGGNH